MPPQIRPSKVPVRHEMRLLKRGLGISLRLGRNLVFASIVPLGPWRKASYRHYAWAEPISLMTAPDQYWFEATYSSEICPPAQ